MATDRGREQGDYPRTCDYCGHRWMWKELKQLDPLRWACPDCYPGLTANQISKFNAKAKPLVVRPRKYAKDYIQTPIYALAEAQTFNFIARAAPADNLTGGTPACLSAAWAAIYMADIILQAKRPLFWSNTATTVLTRCCDFLLTRQAHTSHGFIYSFSDIQYGGLTDGTPTADLFSTATFGTSRTIAAGIAFVKAYSITGQAKYIEGADACAHFLRNVQSANIARNNFTVYPVGGSAFRVGGMASGVRDKDGLILNSYNIADIAALWFLTLLGQVRGTSAVYGTDSSSAFTGNNHGALAEMIAELTQFATVGVMDSVTGTVRTGLSPTQPRPTYDAALDGFIGTASWPDVSNISADSVCLAIRGLYEADRTSALASTMVSWLRSMGSNPANATPAGNTEEQTLQGLTGTFNPLLCTAAAYTVTEPFTEDVLSPYAWSSYGLIAPIISALDPGGFRTSKDTFSTAQRYTTTAIDLKYIGPIGVSGLSLQLAEFDLVPSVVRAAKAGNIYRVDPGRYPLLRGN